MTPERLKARHEILAAANAERAPWAKKPYTMRHIQRAVCTVRRRRLVKPGVLIAAGFNPGGDAS